MATTTRVGDFWFTRLRPMAGLAALLWAIPAGAASEWLAICAKCVSPQVFSRSGIGTSNAVALARITPAAVAEWCGSWQPDDKGCIQQQSAAQDMKQVYRASADCTAGRISPIDGNRYTLAGVWDNRDIGAGRSRWRDSSGKIVGRDNASGGLGISQQWELLCPASTKAATSGATSTGAAPSAQRARAPAPVDQFAVGQQVLARYGGDWVRARVDGIRRSDGPNGAQTHYDVTLENGKRGGVPERMLRPGK